MIVQCRRQILKEADNKVVRVRAVNGYPGTRVPPGNCNTRGYGQWISLPGYPFSGYLWGHNIPNKKNGNTFTLRTESDEE